MNNFFLEEAIKEAKKSLRTDDVPIGAVIVHNGEIIARAHNEVERKGSPLKHAEVIAIERARKKFGNKYLNDCEMYVTLEPCPMCFYACYLMRLKKIYYGCKSDKTGFSKFITLKIETENLENVECSKMLSEFFEKLR